jgi:hypothetical protein
MEITRRSLGLAAIGGAHLPAFPARLCHYRGTLISKQRALTLARKCPSRFRAT